MNIERSRLVKILGPVLALVIVLVGVAAFNGFETSRAEGTCYTTIKKCQGLPLDGCVGEMSETTEFVEKSQCSQIENITSECRNLKNEACKLSGDWRENAQAYGRTCRSWNERYELGLESC